MGNQLKQVTSETFNLESVPDCVKWLAVDNDSTYGTLLGYEEMPWTITGNVFLGYKMWIIAEGYAYTPEPIQRPQ